MPDVRKVSTVRMVRPDMTDLTKLRMYGCEYCGGVNFRAMKHRVGKQSRPRYSGS